MQQINPQNLPPNDGDADDLLAALAKFLPLTLVLSGCVIYTQQISSEVAVLKTRQELSAISTKESLASLKEDMQELKALLQHKEVKPNERR